MYILLLKIENLMKGEHTKIEMLRKYRI